MAGVAALAGVLLGAPSAWARGPYVTLRDDGTLAGTVRSPALVLDKVMKAYDASGAKRPDVISLWTSFPQSKSEIETLFDPASNDVKGIGLEAQYDGDGTFDTGYAPLRAVLLHNDVTKLEKRAAFAQAPASGYAQYLFLLELSHVWGPSVRLPAADGGSGAGALIGFPYHWSFWMDAGGSPAGGNAWKDNGDGTFTTLAAAPKDITYSMLDLYLMGLADPEEVTPFGVLENAEPPPDVKDPFTGKPLSATSFPHFGPTPVTVKATRRTVTIADVVQANGPRVPARSASPQSFELAIVLMVGADATDEDVAAAEAAMDPVAESLAPAFERATRGRGKMVVVTQSFASDAPPSEDATSPAPESDAAAAAPSAGSGGASGCSAGPSVRGDVLAFVLASVAAIFSRRRKRA